MAGVVVSRMLGFAAKNVKPGVLNTQGVFVIIDLHVTVNAFSCDTYGVCCIKVYHWHLERTAEVVRIIVLNKA